MHPAWEENFSNGTTSFEKKAVSSITHAGKKTGNLWDNQSPWSVEFFFFFFLIRRVLKMIFWTNTIILNPLYQSQEAGAVDNLTIPDTWLGMCCLGQQWACAFPKQTCWRWPRGMPSKEGRQSEVYFNIVTDKSQCEIGIILSPFHVKEIK